MSAQDNGALNRSAALASIAMASVRVALKGWDAWSTGSSAMLGSLADTLLDLVASMATLAGVWVAHQPADENHRFGHGKAEALAAMFQVVLIALSAAALGVHSVQQLLSGTRTGDISCHGGAALRASGGGARPAGGADCPATERHGGKPRAGPASHPQRGSNRCQCRPAG